MSLSSFLIRSSLAVQGPLVFISINTHLLFCLQSPAEVSVEAANNADPSSSLMPPPPPPPPLPSEDATVHLTYVTPEQVEGIRQLNLQFPRKVMAGIRRRAFAGDHVTDAEVDSFNSILEHEIGCSLKFSLSGKLRKFIYFTREQPGVALVNILKG